MCSSCGGGRSKLPGSNPKNPIVFGKADGRAPYTATFLVDHEAVAKKGQYRYVAGDGIEAAVEAGILAMGFEQRPRSAPRARPVKSAPDYYVKTGNNKWVGFRSRESADRYAKARGETVLTKDEVLAAGGTPA